MPVDCLMGLEGSERDESWQRRGELTGGRRRGVGLGGTWCEPFVVVVLSHRGQSDEPDIEAFFQYQAVIPCSWICDFLRVSCPPQPKAFTT